MKFSERAGIKSVKSTIQIESIDIELKNGLWNVFLMHYGNPMIEESIVSIKSSIYLEFIENIWFSFFKLPIDRIPYHKADLLSNLRKDFFEWEWYQIYDFIEFIVKNPDPEGQEELIDNYNIILKRELSGYRFIGTEIIQITDENQITEIQKALNSTEKNTLNGVNIHLQTALMKISDKKNPDYRNSIKESISAIESLSQLISGNKKAELGKTLKLVTEKTGIHKALEQGFIKIYGYTSDGDGIRHSLLEESNLDYEDALFMLISCSAFINYMIIKANKSDIILT